jgi:hypothetical protein
MPRRSFTYKPRPATLVINWLAFIYFAFNKQRLLPNKKAFPALCWEGLLY